MVDERGERRDCLANWNSHGRRRGNSNNHRDERRKKWVVGPDDHASARRNSDVRVSHHLHELVPQPGLEHRRHVMAVLDPGFHFQEVGELKLVEAVAEGKQASVDRVQARINFRPPDIGSSRGERFLALDGQADTQPTSGVAHPFRIQLST